MKRVVLLDNLDVPYVLNTRKYKKYIKLIEKYITKYFKKPSALVDIKCPGCDKKNKKTGYKKMSMKFTICPRCGSHYVNPRPQPTLLEKFYKESKACRVWREDIRSLNEEQLHYIIGPRLRWIQELTDEYLTDNPILLDVETKYPHLLQRLIKENEFKTVLSYRTQLFENSDLLPKEVGVLVNNPSDDTYRGRVGLITAFETLERMFDPREFFDLAKKYCQAGGLLLITTASCSGFEYQVLGKDAPNINPINRMNLLSLEAISKLIQKAGFELIELSTPGRLDVEIARKAAKESEAIHIDPFWKYIFDFRDEKTWLNLQNFLQENRLSSHVRIAARKKMGSA